MNWIRVHHSSVSFRNRCNRMWSFKIICVEAHRTALFAYFTSSRECRFEIRNKLKSKRTFIFDLGWVKSRLPRHSGGPTIMLAVLRICDILVRIRIRGPVPLTNGSGSGSGPGSRHFRQWPSRRQLKLFFIQKFFSYYFWSYIYILKKSYRSHKTVGIKVFLTIFAWLQNRRIRTSYYWIRIRIQKAQKHTDTVDRIRNTAF